MDSQWIEAPMMSYQLNDTLIRLFLGPDMTDLEYKKKKKLNSFFKVLQFHVYLIVKAVIFKGHFCVA